MSFTPEPALKDIINRPFSHFETVVLNDATVLEDTLQEMTVKMMKILKSKLRNKRWRRRLP